MLYSKKKKETMKLCSNMIECNIIYSRSMNQICNFNLEKFVVGKIKNLGGRVEYKGRRDLRAHS